MARTYYPGAVKIAATAHKYLTRYQATLTSGQTAQRVTALVNLVACLATFLAEWNAPPINP